MGYLDNLKQSISSLKALSKANQKGNIASLALAIGIGVAVLIFSLVFAALTWQNSQTQIATVTDVNISANILSAGRSGFSAFVTFASFLGVVVLAIMFGYIIRILGGTGGGNGQM